MFLLSSLNPSVVPDVATRLSWRCCERLVEVNAVGVIYRLILSCNRSLPHMELIKFSVSILLNLAKVGLQACMHHVLCARHAGGHMHIGVLIVQVQMH